MNLIGYAPDVDQTQEGVITACTSFIPTDKGMQAAPSANNLGIAALAAACKGAMTVRKLDNSYRTIAGTATNLYELSGTTWTDVSRAVGGAYALGTDDKWRIAQFGDTTLAVAKTDTLQASSSGAFANVTGAPKADLIETVNYFVFLANTNEGTYGDSPNRWWCSAISDYTNWTPAVSTQCTTGILTSAPGRIFAMKRFGDQIVFYKEQAMYIGTNVGPPVVWDIQQVPGGIGCSSQKAVVSIGTSTNPIHIFMGSNDFWIFDGARPVSIGAPVRKTVFSNLYDAYSYRIDSLHDARNQRVFFYYPSLGGGGAVDSCVVYNYKTQTWGRDDRTVETAFEYLPSGVTYDTWNTIGATYDTLPSTISYDSPFLTSAQTVPVFFDTTHTLFSLDGVAGNCSFTTGDIGNDDQFLLMKRVKPRWLTSPTYATMTNYYKNAEGDALNSDATTIMSSSRFDVLRSARWHRLQFNTVGDCVTNQIEFIAQGSGNE